MKQVFQTQDSTRWNRFKWTVRVLGVFLLVSITSILISLFFADWKNSPTQVLNEKRIQNVNYDTKKKKISDKELKSFVKHLEKVRKQNNKDLYIFNKKLPETLKDYYPVRAGFYVNWNADSYFSLKKNASKINMVLPEWLFQTTSTGEIRTEIDQRALNTMRKNKLAIIPMLSNNFSEKFHGDSTLASLKNKKTRAHIIEQIKTILKKNHFQGINIDLECLPKGSASLITNFSKELHEALQPEGLLTTIDINPYDANYDLPALDKYYDFIFVMAYDEHYINGEPGCITSLNFIEQSLDNAMSVVPSHKFILCLAAYGYKWKKGENGHDVTYDEFLSLALENNAPIQYDDNHSDIYINYTDDENTEWEAHCCDATSIYNAMRTAYDYDAAGVALWYLGGEDSRIWSFYNKHISMQHLKKNPFNYRELEDLHSMYSVNFYGKGEVLDFMSKPQNGFAKISIDTNSQIIAHEEYERLPVSYLIKRYKTKSKKYIAITFDDGPDPSYTPDLLDVLKEKNVKATFFVIGVNAERNIPLLKRIYDEGHEVGNHTFTHPRLEYSTDARERIELRSTQLLIESVLGRTTLLFRPPYNINPDPETYSEIKPLAIANDEGFLTIASSIDPNDWQVGVTVDSIMNRLDRQQGRGNILLLHDSGGERSATVKALPQIIDYYRSKGYEFVTISELIGKKRDDLMPKIKGYEIVEEKVNYAFLILAFIMENFLQGFFFVAILLGVLRLLSLLFFAVKKQIEFKRKPIKKDPMFNPKVTVIVPAYNEELNAVRTIDNLLKSDYLNLNILFVDDGSKDNTYSIVNAAFENNPKVKVMTKPNGGKASALNFGIQQAECDILVCIDADTVLLPDAISQMIPYFQDEEVGAVAGNVRVGNTVNMLTNWQKIEYTTSQNFDRVAFDAVNAILVVPGAIGAFRKEAIDEVGGFTLDTLAEDCDLTVRILREGYKVKTCNKAISLTEAPESVKMFIKQRFRWTFGMMQCFWKHRDLLFNTRQANIGWILLPNLLIFGFIIPLFGPIVDIFLIKGFFSDNGWIYILFYMLYFVVDLILSYIAYRFDNQKFGFKLAFKLFIQRFVYRQILFVVLMKSYQKAIKGELAHWGVLKRTGNMKMD